MDSRRIDAVGVHVPLGSRQVVRHRILIPAFVGSIPTSPAILFNAIVPAFGRAAVARAFRLHSTRIFTRVSSI